MNPLDLPADVVTDWLTYELDRNYSSLWWLIPLASIFFSILFAYVGSADTRLEIVGSVIAGTIIGTLCSFVSIFMFESNGSTHDVDRDVAFQTEKALAKDGYVTEERRSVWEDEFATLRDDGKPFTLRVADRNGDKRTAFISVEGGDLLVEVLPDDAKDDQ